MKRGHIYLCEEQRRRSNLKLFTIWYVLNNPLRYNDPYGWWTFGLGFNFNFGGIFGFSVSVSLIFDAHGGVALAIGKGGGAYAGVGGSLTVQGQWTSADSVKDLKGTCVQTGASGGEIWNVGAEWIAAEGYQGVNVQGGVGGGGLPIEIHSVIENTSIITIRQSNTNTEKPNLPVEHKTIEQKPTRRRSGGHEVYD